MAGMVSGFIWFWLVGGLSDALGLTVKQVAYGVGNGLVREQLLKLCLEIVHGLLLFRRQLERRDLLQGTQCLVVSFFGDEGLCFVDQSLRLEP